MRSGTVLIISLILAGTIFAVVALAPNLETVSPPWLALVAPSERLPATPPATLTWLNAPTATPLPSPTTRPTATPITPAPSPTPTQAPVLSRAIFIDQDAQIMHVYENGIAIRTIPCSTGVPQAGMKTPAWVGRVGAYAGTFRSFGVYADEGWYLFADFFIHSAPYTWENGVKVYQELDALGQRPASHGCIRLPPEDARWLTEWDPLGVPVAISPLTRQDWP